MKGNGLVLSSGSHAGAKGSLEAYVALITWRKVASMPN
jgi:hypothetical protein